MELSAAEKVFAIPELRCLIEYTFRGKMHPIAFGIQSAVAARRGGAGRPHTRETFREAWADGTIPVDEENTTPDNAEMNHRWAVEQYMRAEHDGSMYGANNIAYCKAVYRLAQTSPSPGRGRFGLLRRPLPGETARPGLAVDSRRRPCARDCASSLWWNWVPLAGDDETGPRAPPGTLALLQAQLLPDVADIIRSAGRKRVHSKPCGIGLTVGYAKNKNLDIARDACPPDEQPDPAWPSRRIVRHILAH